MNRHSTFRVKSNAKPASLSELSRYHGISSKIRSRTISVKSIFKHIILWTKRSNLKISTSSCNKYMVLVLITQTRDRRNILELLRKLIAIKMIYRGYMDYGPWRLPYRYIFMFMRRPIH